MTSVTRRPVNRPDEEARVESAIGNLRAGVFGDVIDYLSIGVILTDAQGQPVWLNRTANSVNFTNI
jgi:hypothetical protein